MLAAWRAAAPVLHLDPAHVPPALMRNSVAEFEGAVVVCKAEVEQLDLPEGARRVDLPLQSSERTRAGTGECDSWDGMSVSSDGSLKATQLSQYNFTSGTTGAPKLIKLCHEATAIGYTSRLAAAPYKGPEREAICIMFTWEVFRPLLVGGTAVLLAPEVMYEPRTFVKELTRRQIDRILTTPSLLQTLLAQDGLLAEAAKTVRTWTTCGEVLPPMAVVEAKAQAPDLRLYNSYSTWESGDVSYGLGKLGQGTLLPGVGVAVLDENGEPVGMGCTGSVVVTGKQLSSGYTVASLTEQKFKPMPALGEGTWYATGDRGRLLSDGLLILGRSDFTVNIRGFKVALALVDGALRSVAGV
jgi:acyl-coenzyme A synthetase/AMP-(fatty) acid ligase